MNMKGLTENQKVKEKTEGTTVSGSEKGTTTNLTHLVNGKDDEHIPKDRGSPSVCHVTRMSTPERLT